MAQDFLAGRFGEAVMDDYNGTLMNAVRITAYTNREVRARWVVLPSGKVRAAWDPDDSLSAYRPGNYALTLGAGDIGE